MKFKTLSEVCKHLGDHFRDWERCEIVVHYTEEVRDNHLIRWGFDALMNPRNEWAGEVLQRIVDRRNELKAELEANPEPVVQAAPSDDTPF